MKKRTIGLDQGRIIAALLIIAIHTYPFESIHENFEFLFTHVFCRIGVPLFFMITGYFVLSKAVTDVGVLVRYLKKIIKWYFICIILYLPVNLYVGNLQKLDGMMILKEIGINGTFYHLWYFPALIVGTVITYGILKKVKNKSWLGFTIVSILYVIGMLGDSYYGIVEKVDFLKRIYQGIFQVVDYTRNGLFYAPMFLYLGYQMKQKTWKILIKKNHFLMILGFAFLLVEGWFLHQFHWQRHDSMYILLIPVMIVVFQYLLQATSKNNKQLRNIATTMYIIHPIIILGVRLLAKVLHLQTVMVDHSLVHYILVVIGTIVVSIIFESGKERIRGKYETRIRTR